MNDVKNILNRHYDLEANSIEKVRKRTTNTNYVVETDTDTYVLKQFYPYPDLNADSVKGHLHLYEALQQTSLPAPNVIKTLKNTLYVYYKNNYWALLEYLPGEPEPERTRKLQDDARLLARFHIELSSYTSPYSFRGHSFENDIDSVTSFTDPMHNFRQESAMKAVFNSDNPFKHKVLKEREIILIAIVKAVHRIWHADFSNKSIIHYDFKPDNLLHKNGELLGIIDFDYSKHDYVELDVVKAAKEYAVEDNNINYRKYKAFVKAYNDLGTCSENWDLHYGLLLFIILRRLVFATRENAKNEALEFLFDTDLNFIKQLLKTPLQ